MVNFKNYFLCHLSSLARSIQHQILGNYLSVYIHEKFASFLQTGFIQNRPVFKVALHLAVTSLSSINNEAIFIVSSESQVRVGFVSDIYRSFLYSLIPTFQHLLNLQSFFSGLLNGWRRQWHPTPVLLPGKSRGWRSLVGYSPGDR